MHALVVTRLTFALLFVSVTADATESTCFGTVSNGRLENGVALPRSGKNFSAYSSMGAAAGRTYVHSKVRDIVVAAYEALGKSMPDKVFVYGETGWASGGRIRPHRTHQNGLSVDFMVPVVDTSGKSVKLPANAANRFGYDIEFDASGRFATYRIDFDAMAEHLFQLHVAATERGARVAQVIFDPALRTTLFGAPRGSYLQQNLRFMQRQAWVRHDEHYHVDFDIACQPLH